MYKKENSLTAEEAIRLDEIIFYNFIHNLFSLGHNPIKLYAFVEVVCSITNCNITILNSVVSTVLTEDKQYSPTREEHIFLLAKAANPVQNTCTIYNISPRTYYLILNKAKEAGMNPTPKYDSLQHAEINKFINALETIPTLTRRV